MKTVNIKGVEVKVVEHMKEIEDNCMNDTLFKRWYNRNQFLKAILGKDTNEYYEYDHLATPAGSLSGENTHCCWAIELYDLKNSSAENIRELAEELRDDAPCYSSCFFIEDRNGKVYFVNTNED